MGLNHALYPLYLIMPWVSPVLLRRRIVRRGCDILGFTDEDVGFYKGVGMWHPGLQIVQENLRISQMSQKSYATIPFFPDLCNTYLEFSSLPWPYQSVFPLCPSSDVGRTKRPWRQCNGWWWENLPVLPILWRSLSSIRAIEYEAATRRNQRLFSSTKRKRSHQEQLAEDSLFLDYPSIDEL